MRIGALGGEDAAVADTVAGRDVAHRDDLALQRHHRPQVECLGALDPGKGELP